MARRIFLASVSTAFLAATLAGTGGWSTAFGTEVDKPIPEKVPFELLKTMHMAIQIKINGKGPYRVIFDTGAPVMLLNTKVARESGVLGKNAKPSLFSIWGNMGQVKIKDLEIAGLKVEDVPVIVLDHPTVELLNKFLGPIEGIIGFPFFARYRMTLDYQARELTFVANGFEPPDAMQNLTKMVMALADENPKPITLAPAAQWGMRLAKEKDDVKPGISIKEVLPESAAAQAGVKPGDRMLTLDGRWTDTLADAFLASEKVKPGTAARVVIQRAGKEIEITVKPRSGL